MRVHEMIKAKKMLLIYKSICLCMRIPISTGYSGLHASGLLDDLILPELQTASLQLKDRMVNENSANSGIN
jgi:hypothetical protein